MALSRFLIAACAALAALPLSGCGERPARVPLKGKRLMVIPFAQGDLKPFESTLGRDLAMGISAAVVGDLPKRAAVLDPQQAERLLPVPRTAEFDWAKLGRALRADYLLLGDIREYRLRDPRALTTRRGTLVVDYHVLDVARGADVLLVPGRAFSFPPDNSAMDPSFNFGTDVFTDPAELSKGLLAVAARGIADEFRETREAR